MSQSLVKRVDVSISERPLLSLFHGRVHCVRSMFIIITHVDGFLVLYSVVCRLQIEWSPFGDSQASRASLVYLMGVYRLNTHVT